MSGNNLQVDYQAPGAIPTPNPVTVPATSVADSTRNASALITVLNHVLVTVLPSTVTLAPLAVQAFAATVLGTSNQNVVWQVQGTACSAGAPCGSIDANGTYTAPGAAPSPNALRVVAISADDTSQSGAANVTAPARTFWPFIPQACMPALPMDSRCAWTAATSWHPVRAPPRSC